MASMRGIVVVFMRGGALRRHIVFRMPCVGTVVYTRWRAVMMVALAVIGHWANER
jgi:hypothetical protein